MDSSTTSAAFGATSTNASYLLGHKLDSRPDSNDIPIVFLITEDTSEQETLRSLISREGWRLETFESAREFLGRPRPLVPSCLILSLALPDPNVLQEQKLIARERTEVPIIVISSHGDVRTSVQAMKAGAVDFFITPFNSEILLLGIRESLERSRLALHREMGISDLRNCYASLSRRERQVMALVVSGLLNKQAGGELGISEITEKAHRRRVMQKMKANSLPDLVRMAAELKPARNPIHSA